MKPELDFVPMHESHLDWVAATEVLTNPFPWSRGNFADSLAAGYSNWVLEWQGEPVAYAVMMLVADEAHLLSIAVVPPCQRQGFAKRMLDQLGFVARRAGATQLFLEVRPSNLPAQSLYQKWGFELIGRRKGYYPALTGREDALVMRWAL